MTRIVDVVVWGATGLTGKRVCLQLAAHYTNTVKWAIAGRNKEKLVALKTELVENFASCKDIPVVVAQTSDPESIKSMVCQGEVVLACAGPFSLYSDSVAEACVREGTHFLDVSGENLWVRTLIDRFDNEAKSQNIKIVNCCGFDSVPSDIGTHYLIKHIREKYDRKTSFVLGCFDIKTKGGSTSGGTLATVKELSKQSTEIQKASNDPYYLNPYDRKPNVKEPKDQFGAVYYDAFGVWTIPFFMQAINKRIVHRSAALNTELYGSSFKYHECLRATNGWNARISTWIMNFGFAIFALPYISDWLFYMGWLPRPGEGPSIEDDAKGSWKTTLYGQIESDSSSSSNKAPIAVASISDHYAPYTSTARMIVECAMCLILDSKKLKENGYPAAGVLTPAVAFGEVLIQRLQGIGFDLQIENP